MLISKTELLERLDKTMPDNAQVQVVEVSWLDEDWHVYNFGFSTVDGYTLDSSNQIEVSN